MELLYRSLLQYNVKTQKIESDIASCDLSNLRTVQCILEPNVKWSNGEFITVDDIYATYNLLQNSDINPII
jgi:ABC-type transport system substrate-binding protein